jgi:hypothetical protein
MSNFVKNFNATLQSSSKYFLNSTFQSWLNFIWFHFVHEQNLSPRTNCTMFELINKILKSK